MDERPKNEATEDRARLDIADVTVVLASAVGLAVFMIICSRNDRYWPVGINKISNALNCHYLRM